MITKPGKGSGVVVMGKSDYIFLVCEASINNQTKFTPVERPPTRGRPPKCYQPLFQKEKHLKSLIWRIPPRKMAHSSCKKGSRLAHLYGLHKTHKERLLCDPFCLQQIHKTMLWQSGWIRRWKLYLSTNTRYATSLNSPKRSNDLQIGYNNFLA